MVSAILLTSASPTPPLSAAHDSTLAPFSFGVTAKTCWATASLTNTYVATKVRSAAETVTPDE